MCEHTRRCSGHCCRSFYLRFSPEQLKAWADGSQPHTYKPEEIKKVADMVIHLGPADDPNTNRPVLADRLGNVIPNQADGGHYYTCKHHNTATGNCDNYENRPDMCRDYPYQDRCRYKACTWEAGKNPPIPAKQLVSGMRNKMMLRDIQQGLCVAEAAAPRQGRSL